MIVVARNMKLCAHKPCWIVFVTRQVSFVLVCTMVWIVTIKVHVVPWNVGKMHINKVTHFVYRHLDFSSEPGVANEILENEPKSCLTVA